MTILDNKQYLNGKAQVFKIPHHGSVTGHNERVWNELLIRKPISCLTPFIWGNLKLPAKEDVERIYKYTNKAYSTSKFKSRKQIKCISPVMKTIKDTVKYLKPMFSSNGQIRIRFKPGNDNSPTIELLNGAVELKDIYNND
ncbi:MAG: hypothetical protein JXB88_21745 [Spirochaetales bacterium]|nr:hypothetical protein [Spirochaetales bacterium]